MQRGLLVFLSKRITPSAPVVLHNRNNRLPLLIFTDFFLRRKEGEKGGGGGGGVAVDCNSGIENVNI